MFAFLLNNKSAKRDFAGLCESPSESRLYDPEIIFRKPPMTCTYIFADFFSYIQCETDPGENQPMTEEGISKNCFSKGSEY
jgi:hypothetical protein